MCYIAMTCKNDDDDDMMIVMMMSAYFDGHSILHINQCLGELQPLLLKLKR